MKCRVLVEIVGKSDYSAEYQTLLCFSKQSNISEYSVYVKTDFPNMAQFKELKTGEVKDYHYHMKVRAGALVSKSFLYKGIEYLKRNNAEVVCPETLFAFNEAEPLEPKVRTIMNTGRIASGLEVSLWTNGAERAGRVRTITDTCAVVRNLPKKHAATVERVLKEEEEKLYTGYYFPSEMMQAELDLLGEIELTLTGFRECQYENKTKKYLAGQEKIAKLFWRAQANLTDDEYGYVMVLPWLIHGGVDLFAINYLNTIAEIHPDEQILAIVTDNSRETLAASELGLKKNVILLDLTKIVPGDEDYERTTRDLLYSIIKSSGAKHLHIMMSKIGYDCMAEYGDDLREDKRIIYSCYNYLVNSWGRAGGYMIEELPRSYRPGDLITTDNQRAKDIWVENYGFRGEDIQIHRQYLPEREMVKHIKHDKVNVLWAAHIRHEKNPEMVVKLAEKLGDAVQIDCYGELDPYEWRHNPFTHNAPENVKYYGKFGDYFKDIDLSKYDIFLYTSLSDGTPNVILETGLAGIPIVSSAVGGIADIVGENGHLVKNPEDIDEFYDNLQAVIKDEKSARKLSEKLHEKIYKSYGKANFVSQVKQMLGEENE